MSISSCVLILPFHLLLASSVPIESRLIPNCHHTTTSCPNGLLWEKMSIYLTYVMLAKQLTIACRSLPNPLSIGHAGMFVVSLRSVPCVTGVGHCGSKCCTRVDSLTIWRSIGGRTTADGYRESTGTAFLVATMASTCTSMQTKGHASISIHVHNHASISTYYIIIQNHTQMHTLCIYTHEPYTPTLAWCMWVHVSACTYVLTIVA